MSAISSSGVGVPASRCRLVGPGDGEDDTPRWAWPVVVRPSSRAVAQSSSQVVSTPSSISAVLLAGDALGVERLRAQAALAQRIVDDADAVRKQLLAELVLQEAGLARDRGAVDGADEMADQRAGDARIEHDRHLAGLDLARIERATARSPAERPIVSGDDRSAPCSAEVKS